jgi:hypothetical protein
MKEKLKKVLEFQKARYISEQYLIKKFGNSEYQNFLDETNFLYSEATLSERIFCYIHDIKEQSCCLHCLTPIKNFERFYKTKEEYLERFCSHSCIRSYMYDMTTEPNFLVDYNVQMIDDIIKNGNYTKIRLKPSLMNYIKIALYKRNIDFRKMTALEALYFLKNNHQIYPKCICGKDLIYLGKGKYRNFCSLKCRANSTSQKELKEKTCIEKYGSKNVFQNKDIQEKIRTTNLEKYGMDHYCKTLEYQERIKNGDIIRRPIDYIKIKHIHFDKMYEKIKKFRDKLNIIPLFTREEYRGSGYDKNYLWKCLKCETEFEHWYYEINKLRCPKCTKHTNIEEKIINYLSSLNIKLQVKSRSIISPYELDVYLPEKKIGIEINGLYWHSELNGTKRLYHLKKTQNCEKQNIRLLQIFADEIMYQEKIVQKRLKHILGLIRQRIYARKCHIEVIQPSLKNKFLNKYHIQGEDKSTINLGLFYKKYLVAVMTFSKLRKVLALEHKENHYELSRFAAINNFVIVGGADKLLKYFERNYNPYEIRTYADRRWSQGDVYYKLGFKLDHISPPNHWYLKNYLQRIYRFNFRKNVLKDKLEKFDPKLSEWENMKANGYDRIWDCGNLVFKKTYSNI